LYKHTVRLSPKIMVRSKKETAEIVGRQTWLEVFRVRNEEVCSSHKEQHVRRPCAGAVC
jgi:hypothetical protein